ncbi:hypothetical protein HN51_004610, partial [Arachis hypogaea]
TCGREDDRHWFEAPAATTLGKDAALGRMHGTEHARGSNSAGTRVLLEEEKTRRRDV